MVDDSLKQTHIYELLLFFGLTLVQLYELLLFFGLTLVQLYELLFFGLTLVQLYELLLFFWFNIGAVNLLWFNFPVFKSNPVSLSLRCF